MGDSDIITRDLRNEHKARAVSEAKAKLNV
jgi:hypothetical protein